MTDRPSEAKFNVPLQDAKFMRPVSEAYKAVIPYAKRYDHFLLSLYGCWRVTPWPSSMVTT